MHCATLSLPTNPRLWSKAEIEKAFAEKRKSVVTFLGFGEMGYENDQELERIINSELEKYSTENTIINTGTLPSIASGNGIFQVYIHAKEIGFQTSGIYPSIALNFPQDYVLPACVDDYYFIEDDTWGGLRDGGLPSNTLQALTAITRQAVVIGGGRHTAQEMQAFLEAGTPLQYHAADMQHARWHDWCARHGSMSCGHEGEAFHVWQAQKHR